MSTSLVQQSTGLVQCLQITCSTQVAENTPTFVYRLSTARQRGRQRRSSCRPGGVATITDRSSARTLPQVSPWSDSRHRGVLICKHLAREQVWFQQRCDPNPNLTAHGNR